MAEERVERRLAAILAADVVGYSRLMGLDESGTLARVRASRAELVEPAIAARSGRVVKLMGDGMLAEFGSVVDAVHCALDIQAGMLARNAALDDDRRIVFRIGINVGDVIVEGDDIYGDGVNVAARLEAMARPGGICISRSARDQVRDKIPLVLEDLGEVAVKNIARPVRAFNVDLDSLHAARAPAEARAETHHADKPSIAVLPFTNMSGDAEQEYFADGTVEDIITALSHFKSLIVIARNSTFVYKGRAVDIRQVAKELDVRYVLEGSVRKAGNRLRITGQLIDATTGAHIWADRFDGAVEDVFDLQDRITESVVGVIEPQIRMAELERSRAKRPDSLDAYDLTMRAKLLHHRGSREDNAEAIDLLDKALALDPEYGHAHAWKACVLGQAWARGYRKESDGVLDEVQRSIDRAYAIDENDCESHRILAALSLMRRQFDKAAFHQERGLALNPNYDLIVVQQGELLTWLGRGEEAAEWIERAMRLNPHHPDRFWSHLARAHAVAGRWREALDALGHVAQPNVAQKALAAACHAELGNDAERARAVADVLAADAGFTAGAHAASLPFKDDAPRDRYVESLLKAGFPA